MKNCEILEQPGTACDSCMGRADSRDACNAEINLPETSDYIWYVPGDHHTVVGCGRTRNHPGRHVACCKYGSNIEGTYQRFHVAWEDG
jgi:hypothetical protein